MKERPILFSTSMVQAILDGRKTQTRRMVKPQPELPTPGQYKFANPPYKARVIDGRVDWVPMDVEDFDPSPYELYEGKSFGIKPKYQIGDVLWVRETWQYAGDTDYYFFKAGMNYHLPLNMENIPKESDPSLTWRPSIFMPRAACRIKLEITDIRVERLGELSQEDAMLEGVTREMGYKFNRGWESAHDVDYRWIFQQLWTKINGSYDPQTWVWAITFKRIL